MEEDNDAISVDVYRDSPEWRAEEDKHERWFMMDPQVLKANYLATYVGESPTGMPTAEQIEQVRAEFEQPVVLVY